MAMKTILIADDDQALAKAIALRCKELGVQVVTCSDGIKAYQTVVRQPPDLLILDLNMPGANGLYLFEELGREQNLSPIPAIILTGKSDDATIQRCKSLGAHYVWKGLDTWSDLKPILCKLLCLESVAQAPQEPQAVPTEVKDAKTAADAPPAGPKVLVVDDDTDVSKAIKIRLRAHGVEVVQAFNGMQGFWAALKERPDVIIMDYRMPEGYGNFLLGKLRSHPLSKDIPVIVLTGQCIGRNKDFALERELLGLGASAFLTKPLDFGALLKELRRHITVAERDIPSAPRATPAR